MTAAVLISGAVLLSKNSTVNKKNRQKNMEDLLGRNQMDELDVAWEIESALDKYTNWDNLFLSDNFKSKYKNRENIIKHTENIENIWCSPIADYEKTNVIEIDVDLKNGIFDKNNYDNITDVYIYEYALNEEGEINDLILIDYHQEYTDTGKRMD